MSKPIPAPRSSVRSLWRYLPLVLLFVLSACTGLAEEPNIVTTLRPAELTAIAPLPTETPRVAASTPVSTTASNTSATAQPTLTPASTQSAAQASTEAATAPGTQEANVIRGVVSGSVSNGTAGGTVPPNLGVMLHIMDEQGQETTADTTVDTGGNYAFKDIPIRPDRGYWVMTTYTDRLFGSTFAQGDPAAPSISLPLKIYEVTTNPDVISISSITTRVNVAADGLQIAQIVRFTNKSDRVFTQATALDKNVYGSVALTVPRGASILGFSDNEQRYSISADGAFITDTKPVLPGDSHSIHVVYSLPYREGMTIEQLVNYPVDGNVELQVSPETISVSANSPQLPSLGLQTQDGDSVKAYGGKLTMATGDVLRYQLTGSVAAANGATAPGGLFSRELMIGLLVGLGLGIAGLGLVFLVRERLTGRRSETDTERQEQIDDLVEQLAMLDDQHANGAISHSVYSRRRERLKLQLAELMDE